MVQRHAFLKTSEKRRYTHACISEAHLGWNYYKTTATPGCFDRSKGKCELDTGKTPAMPRTFIDEEDREVTLWDSCTGIDIIDETGIGNHEKALADYFSRFVGRDDYEKNVASGKTGYRQ